MVKNETKCLVLLLFHLIGRKLSSKTSVLSVSTCMQGLLLKDWDSVTHSNIAEVKHAQSSPLVILFTVAHHYDSLMSREQISYLCTIIGTIVYQYEVLTHD